MMGTSQRSEACTLIRLLVTPKESVRVGYWNVST